MEQAVGREGQPLPPVPGTAVCVCDGMKVQYLHYIWRSDLLLDLCLTLPTSFVRLAGD